MAPWPPAWLACEAAMFDRLRNILRPPDAPADRELDAPVAAEQDSPANTPFPFPAIPKEQTMAPKPKFVPASTAGTEVTDADHAAAGVAILTKALPSLTIDYANAKGDTHDEKIDAIIA